MYMKIHRYSGASGIVAVCDTELINTTLKDGDITIHVTDAFYGTTICSEEQVKDVIQHAANCNLIGEKAVQAAVDCGVLEKNGYMLIGNVPHAQIYRA